MAKLMARRWLVSGRVQGVGFRFFVQRKATALGVNGWARNLEDGRVEVYASGRVDKLDDLGALLSVGPPMSEVRSVECCEDAGSETSRGFAIR